MSRKRTLFGCGAVLMGLSATSAAAQQCIPEFKTPAVFESERCGTRGLALAEIDAENGLDLAVTHYGNGFCGDLTATGIAVFRNTGNWAANPPTSGFDTPTYYDIGNNEITEKVQFADLNGDSYPDMLVSSESANLWVFMNLGVADPGVFDDPVSYSAYYSPGGEDPDVLAGENFVVGDFNYDGKLDVAFAGATVAIGPNGHPAIVFLWGNTDWSTAPTLGALVLDGTVVDVGDDIVAANLNSDSLIDLAVTGGNADSIVYIALNAGSGSFTTPNQNPAHGSVAITATRLDSDNSTDAAILYGNAAYWMKGGSGSLNLDGDTPYSVDDGPADIAAAQVFCGAKADIFVVNQYGDDTYPNHGSLTVFVNKGSQNNHLTLDRYDFEVVPHNSGRFPKPCQLVLGDMDEDGRLDVITSNNADNSVSVLISGPFILP